MQFSTAQLIAICLGAFFGVIVILVLFFALYATSRARREDKEANRAVIGRWKEVGDVSIRHVPNPVKRSNGPTRPATQPSGLPAMAQRPVRRESLDVNVKGWVQGVTVPEPAYNSYRHVPPSQTLSSINRNNPGNPNAGSRGSVQKPLRSQSPKREAFSGHYTPPITSKNKGQALNAAHHIDGMRKGTRVTGTERKKVWAEAPRQGDRAKRVDMTRRNEDRNRSEWRKERDERGVRRKKSRDKRKR